jgi:cutinase
MGIVPGPGPQTCSVLKDYYGSDNVACQGVGGGQYGRNVLDNFQPQGATQAAINEGARLFRLANSKCPGTKITAGGWR